MLELPVPLPGPRVQDGVKLIVVPPVWANDQQQAACPSTDLPDIYVGSHLVLCLNTLLTLSPS